MIAISGRLIVFFLFGRHRILSEKRVDRGQSARTQFQGRIGSDNGRTGVLEHGQEASGPVATAFGLETHRKSQPMDVTTLFGAQRRRKLQL